MNRGVQHFRVLRGVFAVFWRSLRFNFFAEPGGSTIIQQPLIVSTFLWATMPLLVHLAVLPEGFGYQETATPESILDGLFPAFSFECTSDQQIIPVLARWWLSRLDVGKAQIFEFPDILECPIPTSRIRVQGNDNGLGRVQGLIERGGNVAGREGGSCLEISILLER